MTATTSPDEQARRLARAVADLIRAHPDLADTIALGIEAGLSAATAENALNRIVDLGGIPDTPADLPGWDDDAEQLREP